MNSCVVVVSVSMVLCMYNIFVPLLMLFAMCKGYCHLAMVCGVSPAFSFDLVTCCLFGKEQRAGVFGYLWETSLLLFSKLYAGCFFPLHHAQLLPGPTGPISTCLNCESGWKNSNSISVFCFLVVDGAEKRRLKGEVNNQRAVSAGKGMNCFTCLQDIGQGVTGLDYSKRAVWSIFGKVF